MVVEIFVHIAVNRSDCGEQASVREKSPECHVKIQADWQYFPSCRTDLKQVNQT